jgi:hypothetical protein
MERRSPNKNKYELITLVLSRDGLRSKGLCGISYKKFLKISKRPLFVTFLYERLQKPRCNYRIATMAVEKYGPRF